MQQHLPIIEIVNRCGFFKLQQCQTLTTQIYDKKTILA